MNTQVIIPPSVRGRSDWLTGWGQRKSRPISRPSGAVQNRQMEILVGESSDLQINGCESTTGWTEGYNASISTDSGIEGTNCIKIHGTGGTYSTASYAPASSMNLLLHNFLSYQHKRVGEETLGRFYIFSGIVNNPPYKYWEFSMSDDWSTQMIDIANPTASSGTVDMSAITCFRFDADGTGQDLYIDDFRSSYAHCEGKCLSNFNDIRFTAADGTTLLDCFIEETYGTTPNQTALFHVEIADVKTTEENVFMYYDNADAPAYSNIMNTFPWADDFSTAWNDPVKWTGDTASGSVSSGKLTLSTTGADKILLGNFGIEGDCMIRARVNLGDMNHSIVGLSESPYSNDMIFIWRHSAAPAHTYWSSFVGGVETDHSTISADFGNYHTYEIQRILDGTDRVKFLMDHKHIVTGNDNVPIVEMFPLLRTVVSNPTNLSCDWIFMKSLLTVEPAWGGSWSAEESA